MLIKTVKQMIDLIETDGWYLVSQKGSHKQFKHPVKQGRVTVPDHGRHHEIDHRLEYSILKQAGLR